MDPAASASPGDRLAGLQQRALEARDVPELCFIVANETWHLVPYRQASVYVTDLRDRLHALSQAVAATAPGLSRQLDRLDQRLDALATASAPPATA